MVQAGIKVTRLARVIKLASFVGGGSIAVQGISFISSILLIRVLATDSFALFTLTYAGLGISQAISDGAVSQAVLTLGGRIHDAPDKLSNMLATARRLMLENVGAASLLVLPLWLWTAGKHSDSTLSLWSLAALIMVTSFFQVGANTYKSILFLKNEIRFVQTSEIIAALVRLLLIAATIMLFPNPVWAVATGVGTDVIRTLFLRHRCRAYCPGNGTFERDTASEIRTFTFKLLPNTVYRAFAGQILLFLLSITGNTSSVAGAGVLTRIQQVFTVVPSIVASLLAPRLAREQDSSNVKSRTWQFTAFCILLPLVVSLPLLTYPGILGIAFGSDYQNIEWETRIFTLSCAIGVAAAGIASCSNARRWLISPWIVIPIHFASMVGAVLIFGTENLKSYAITQCIVSATMFTINITWCVINNLRSKSYSC
jgi:hypothetical protein